MRLTHLLLACAASLAAYLAVFTFGVSKPLTLGSIPPMVEAKRAHAAAVPSPKIVLLAASNARYSHSCEVIGAALGMPCANLGVAAGLSLDYLRAEFGEVLKPGDVVYMPLEYGWYTDLPSPRVEYAIWAAWGHDRLLALPPGQLVPALLYFDLKYAVAALAEMGLQRSGFQRQERTRGINAAGDQHGHTRENGRGYALYLSRSPGDIPPLAAVENGRNAHRALDEFLRWAKERNITVVGGLPTTFADLPVSQEMIARIRKVYEDAGQSFAALPNRSLYPRDCFFDTHYHLHEECQASHSRAVAELLRPRVAR